MDLLNFIGKYVELCYYIKGDRYVYNRGYSDYR